MAAPLVRPIVLSIYESAGQRVLMPERMARSTPDLKKALYGIRTDVEAAGGKVALSDLFRSYDMQLQAHLDFVSKKKSAFSPEPGGSMHESGRAFDIDLKTLKMKLADFWVVAKKWGVVPIIAEPDPGAKECWHFECRGSHQLVYDHYKAGKGTNFKPAQAMAASAIVAAGLVHDRFKGKEDAAYIQSGLIRLGADAEINIDGDIGPKSLAAMAKLGVTGATRTEQVKSIEALLVARFPDEYFDRVTDENTHLL